MGVSFLAARLEALRASQNSDGGWSYFRGKQSWLEPTAYAALALRGEPAADRAWALLKSWQAKDGGWHPGADVQIPHWDTALCVTLASSRGDFGDAFQKGVDWLLNSSGVESRLLSRAFARVGMFDPGRDLSLKGWPWKPGTASWVEPTSHTLVALKKASAKIPGGSIAERIRLGEAQLFDVRCRDGGWNYGSREARGIDLPSYPETTAIALVGLQGHAGLTQSLQTAGRMVVEYKSPMARAWLRIALRLHGAPVPEPPATDPLPDTLITALEALGAPEGNYEVLKTGGVT